MGHLTIEHYGYRYWAVYEGEDLVVVTVYRKGAREVVRRLEQGKEEPQPVDSLQLQDDCPLCQMLRVECRCIQPFL